jgi:hypothetical protein
MKYTEEFIRTLIAKWLNKNYEDNQAHEDIAKSCHYSLVENYVPDSPGWCGSILTVVFGYPSAIVNFRILHATDPQGDEVRAVETSSLERIDSEM